MRSTPPRATLALFMATALAGLAPAAVTAAPAPAPAAPASAPANVVRPEFATPFTAAQDLMKTNKGAEALAKLKEAEAIGNLSPYEQYLVLRVRAPAEYAAGDMPGAARDFETLLSSDQLPAADRLPMMKALSELLYSSSKFPEAATWMQRYIDAGGNDPQLRELLPQTQYMNKDYASAAKGFEAQVDAQLAAGQKPTEKMLRLLASAQNQSSDDAGYAKTIERLAVAYPKPDYWKDVISRAQRSEKYSDRELLEVYRLKAAAFRQVEDRERLTYASLAQRAGYPGEAKLVLDEGLAKKSFTGADVGEATKLQGQATRAAAQDKAQAAANESAAKSAKDGEALVGLGVAATAEGNGPQGVALIDQGISKGGLKRPDEARLHLGVAQYRAGNYPEALRAFQAVTVPGGVGSLAHVWALLAQSKMAPAAPVAAAGSAPAQ